MITDPESYYEGLCHGAEIAGTSQRGKTAEVAIKKAVTTGLLRAGVNMRHQFDLTEDGKAERRQRRIIVLTAMHNELWDDGDLVGCDKCEHLVNHLKSEEAYLKDQLGRPVFIEFPEGGQ